MLFSRSVMSDSLQPHRLQHTRLPCSFTISRSLLKLMSIESVIPSNHLILCRPLLLLLSVFPSNRVFFNESSLFIRWSKYWSFSISPSKEYSVLISFRIDWFDLLASLAPQFESISSLALSLLYGLTFTCIHYYWKNHGFDYTELCWHVLKCLCFLICYLGLSLLFFQEASVFKFHGCSHHLQ